jgi:hypothetical protein
MSVGLLARRLCLPPSLLGHHHLHAYHRRSLSGFSSTILSGTSSDQNAYKTECIGRNMKLVRLLSSKTWSENWPDLRRLCDNEFEKFNDVNWSTLLLWCAKKRKRGPFREPEKEAYFNKISRKLRSRLEQDSGAFSTDSLGSIAHSLSTLNVKDAAIFRAITDLRHHIVDNGSCRDIALVARACAKMEVKGLKSYMECVDAQSEYIIQNSTWEDVEMISAAFEKAYFPFGGGGMEWWRGIHEHDYFREKVNYEREMRGGRFGRL